MAEKNKSPMMNIPMVLGLVLLCLTLISTHFTAGLYARYVAKASGEDSARVAKFKIDDVLIYEGSEHKLSESFSLGIRPGDETKYIVKIDNQSEVSVKCYLTIKNLYRNIPFEMNINGIDSVNGEVSTEFDLQYGEDAEYELKLHWDVEDALNYMKKVDLIEVTLRVEQID